MIKLKTDLNSNTINKFKTTQNPLVTQSQKPNVPISVNVLMIYKNNSKYSKII